MSVEVLTPGLTAWTNELGIRCYFHHYTAHPGRRGRWAESESKKYPGGRAGARWRKEQEGDPSARPGDSLYKGFVLERNVIDNEPVLPLRDANGKATGWYHVPGIDWGGSVPNACVFWANRPSPTWTKSTGESVPILPKGQWVAYTEVYKPECPTRELKLALYREAVFYLGLKNWEPFNNYVTEVFSDPAGKQFRLDFDDPGSELRIRVAIGHPMLDAKLNDRKKGIELLNTLFTPQKQCCGIDYYGENIECERCHEVMPSIPGAVVMRRCENLIRELQIAVKPKARFPGEEVKDGKLGMQVPQHAVDASRYALTGGEAIIADMRAKDNRKAPVAKDGFEIDLWAALEDHVLGRGLESGFTDLAGSAGRFDA